VAEEDKAVVHVRNMGLLHIQRELQPIFQKPSACFAYRFSMATACAVAVSNFCGWTLLLRMVDDVLQHIARQLLRQLALSLGEHSLVTDPRSPPPMAVLVLPSPQSFRVVRASMCTAHSGEPAKASVKDPCQPSARVSEAGLRFRIIADLDLEPAAQSVRTIFGGAAVVCRAYY
jgi:hypothetical protein